MSDEIGNPFDAVRRAADQARYLNRAIDESTATIAQLLVGRLRTITGHQGARALADLKKELRDFNAGTRRWKS